MHGSYPVNGHYALAAAPGLSDGSRLLDIVISLAMLVFAAPLLLLVAALVKLQDGGPVLYEHTRIGYGERPFGCLKFRSMSLDADSALATLLDDPVMRLEWETTQKLRSDPRVTKLGRFLRKSSLDELPQLWNVLRGDMSLVGPRPITLGETGRYGRYIRHYCGVRPGLTGLWQVSGRDAVPYRRRVAMDVHYARSRSVPGDLMILLRTVPAVLLTTGAS